MAYIKVFNHYVHTPYLVLSAIEFCLLFASLYIGTSARLPGVEIHLGDLSDPFHLKATIFSLVMVFCTLAVGVYEARFREGFSGVALRTLVAYCLLGAVGLTVLYYLLPEIYVGRGVLSISIFVAVALVLVARFIFFKIVDVQKLQRRIMVLGAGRKAQRTLELLKENAWNGGFVVVGCMPCGPAEIKVSPEKVIAQKLSIKDTVKELHVHEILVALDERRQSEGGSFPLGDLLDAKLSGIKVTDAIEFHERETGKIELSLLSPSWMVFSSGFRYSQSRDFIKRIFDILICLILLTFALPAMLLTAILVFLDDGAPVLFKQVRVGLNGKHFTIYKFRSMRKDAEKDGAQWAKKNDSRITRVGNFIRNTRLDELPQIYNVLKGDMSFVGPRPERPEFVGDLATQIPYFDERHRVKPGLMGWAQLKYPYGASAEDAAQKLRYDLYYTKNHSIILDLLIVIQTVEVILLGKGVR